MGVINAFVQERVRVERQIPNNNQIKSLFNLGPKKALMNVKTTTGSKNNPVIVRTGKKLDLVYLFNKYI